MAAEPGFATTDATDPYLWLEEIDGTRALDWVRAQNAATERKLATQPLYQELRREALAALDSPSRLPGVNQMGKWIYNFWKDDQHPRGIYRRATLEELRKPNPAWEVVLDVDDLAKREGKPWVFHGMDCLPPEYTECLVSLSPGGGDADQVRRFDRTWPSSGKALSPDRREHRRGVMPTPSRTRPSAGSLTTSGRRHVRLGSAHAARQGARSLSTRSRIGVARLSPALPGDRYDTRVFNETLLPMLADGGLHRLNSARPRRGQPRLKDGTAHLAQ